MSQPKRFDAADQPGLSARTLPLVNREFLILTYRTDPEALARRGAGAFGRSRPSGEVRIIRMPDSTGFGDYTESGQVIPAALSGQNGGYVHSMYLNDEAPIAGAAKSGFPRSWPIRPLGWKRTRFWVRWMWARSGCRGTMGYKYKTLDPGPVKSRVGVANFC